ncbi:MAG TPA: CPBP family glutamic-type intramembrane protease [Actinomycetota bacterium]|nr:CPBP family glutamic-type intramembrane protease [Actinomycetota bacterium]
MDELVTCPDCGTTNRPGADLCAQCWRALTEDALSKIPVVALAATAPAAPPTAPPAGPPPPVAPPVSPLRAPSHPVPPGLPRRLAQQRAISAPAPLKEAAPVREATPGPVPYFAPTASAPPSTIPDTLATPAPAPRKQYSWRPHHLALVAAAAWGIPYFAQWTLVRGRTGRSLVDAGLAVQVGAYLIAAVLLGCLVHLVQRGDWGSVGLKRSERTPVDLATGALLGLVLIGSFLGGIYLLTGHFGSDMLVRILLGGTTGPGAVLGAFVLVVGAPFIEEAYFRGMLYERFAKWGVGAAIVGTSVLFVLFHGVGLWDPPRLLLGFALGITRRTRSLWFTIAAHAAWNGAIVVIAVVMMSGPAHGFTSTDGSFSLTHPAKWERMEQVEGAMPGGRVELVLSTPAGSFLGVFSGEVPAGVNRSNLGALVQRAQATMPLPPGGSADAPKKTNVVMRGVVPAYEATVRVTDPTGVEFKGRIVIALPDRSSTMVGLVMACPASECAAADSEFDAMLDSVRFEL